MNTYEFAGNMGGMLGPLMGSVFTLLFGYKGPFIALSILISAYTIIAIVMLPSNENLR